MGKQEGKRKGERYRRRWDVNPRAMARLEGLSKLKNQ
jgi:hypothetical protein